MGNYFLQLQALKNGTREKDPPKEKKPIAPVSEKKKKELKEEKPDRDKQLQWFKDRVRQSKGECMECGCKIDKSNFTFAIMTVAHVLPKRDNQFPSVKTHKDNSLELCVTNGCHDRYDKDWETAAQMKCWTIAVAKFIKIYPSIAPKERKNIPDVLMQEIKPSIILASMDEDLKAVIVEKG